MQDFRENYVCLLEVNMLVNLGRRYNNNSGRI